MFTLEKVKEAIEEVENAFPAEISLLSMESEIDAACDQIKQFKVIALDLEGRNLGKAGDIGLLQIALENGSTFMFDLAGMEKISSSLKEILETESIKKIMFDCRQDSSALFYKLDTKLDGVADLQLKEILAREDSTDEARMRLHGALYFRSVEGSKELYNDVIRLNSFSKCLEEHGIGNVVLKNKVSASMKSDEHYWMKRPLSQDALNYAKQDVLLLFELADFLYSSGGVDAAITDIGLLACSKKYSKLKIVDNVASKYLNHALLPLNILDETSIHYWNCICCKRNISKIYFPKSAARLMAKRKCSICRAIDIQAALQIQWDKRDFDEDEYYGSD